MSFTVPQYRHTNAERGVFKVNFPTHIVAAAGYVEDKSGNILIVKTHNRGWDAPGGQIEVGEKSEVMWVPKTQIMNYITAPAMRFRFEKMLNFNGEICYCSYVTKPEFQVLRDRSC